MQLARDEIHRAGWLRGRGAKFVLKKEGTGDKKSSHRWGRNLWKPWSRGLLAPMVSIIPETGWNAKIFPKKRQLFGLIGAAGAIFGGYLGSAAAAD
jgi:hypothetical protein